MGGQFSGIEGSVRSDMGVNSSGICSKGDTTVNLYGICVLNELKGAKYAMPSPPFVNPSIIP